MSEESTPHFLFVLPKRKRAVDGPKEKTLGANLHVRASLLKTRVFRICADWNRKSFAGSRQTCSVAEDWLPLQGIEFNKNTVQCIESGNRFVTDLELKAIAQVLGVTADELLSE